MVAPRSAPDAVTQSRAARRSNDHLGGRFLATLAASTLVFAGACGDDSDDARASGSGGVVGAGGGPTGGTPAVTGGIPGASGGAPGTGGTPGASGGAPGTGGTGQAGGTTAGSGGGTSALCNRGQRTATGTCYVPCSYDPGATPYFESGTECQSMGYRCSHFSYCVPNVECVADATCTTFTGAGYECLNAASGPLVGECGIHCTTNADCPPPVAATGTPYRCGPAETAAGTTTICRFEGI